MQETISRILRNMRKSPWKTCIQHIFISAIFDIAFLIWVQKAKVTWNQMGLTICYNAGKIIYWMRLLLSIHWYKICQSISINFDCNTAYRWLANQVFIKWDLQFFRQSSLLSFLSLHQYKMAGQEMVEANNGVNNPKAFIEIKLQESLT